MCLAAAEEVKVLRNVSLLPGTNRPPQQGFKPLGRFPSHSRAASKWTKKQPVLACWVQSPRKDTRSYSNDTQAPDCSTSQGRDQGLRPGDAPPTLGYTQWLLNDWFSIPIYRKECRSEKSQTSPPPHLGEPTSPRQRTYPALASGCRNGFSVSLWPHPLRASGGP